MLKDKTFYPELVGKILKITEENFEILLDNGQVAFVEFLDKQKNKLNLETIQKYFTLKAEKNTKSNSIAKMKDYLSNDEKLQEELSNQIISENPSIATKPMEMLKILQTKLDELAKQKTFEKFLIKENSVIRFAGITLYKDNELYISSQSIDIKYPESGVYMFAVGFNTVPIVIEQNKNGKFIIKLSPLVNDLQLKTLEIQFMNTFKAAIDGNINNIPSIYVSTSKELYKKLDDKSKKIIEILNNKDKLKLDNVDYIREYAKNLKGLLKWFKLNPFDISIYLPLGISNEEYLDIIDKTLNDKNGISDKLIRTTFIKYKEHEIKLKEEIKNSYYELYNNKFLKFNTTFFSHDKYGFFGESVSRNFSLSSNCYNDLIDNISKLTKTFK